LRKQLRRDRTAAESPIIYVVTRRAAITIIRMRLYVAYFSTTSRKDCKLHSCRVMVVIILMYFLIHVLRIFFALYKIRTTGVGIICICYSDITRLGEAIPAVNTAFALARKMYFTTSVHVANGCQLA